MPELYDAFDSEPVCSPIGFADNDPTTTVTSDNGRLAIAPGANTTSTRGGCIAGKMAFTAQSGVFMHATSLPDGAEYKFFALYWVGSPMNTTVFWNTTDVVVTRAMSSMDPNPLTVADVTFDPIATAWVRVRPSDDGTAILVETSADGLTWNVIGTDTVTPPTSVGITMYGGTFAAESAPRTIYFDDFNVCPI